MVELLILCLKILVCRIIDVSLATIRMVVIVKGKTLLSAIIALVEGLVWFLIVREALLFEAVGVAKFIIAVAYSGGFAIGTYVGGILSKKFVKGMVQVQVVTSEKNDKMLEDVRNAGYALTVVDINASQFSPEKYMLFSEMSNTELNNFKKLIYKLDEKAFIMVHETKYVFNGFFKEISK